MLGPMSVLSSNFIDAGGVRLHYLDGGEGAPVLLLHGWPTSSFLYRNVAPHIVAAGRRVIAVDLPGFGQSDKPLDASYSFKYFGGVLTAFLDALALPQVGLVVHDLGGPIGLHWMVSNPGRVTELALLNTLVYPRPSWAVVAFIAATYIPLVKGRLVSPWGLELAMKVGTSRAGAVTPELVAGVQAPFVDSAARKALLKTAQNLHPGGLGDIAEGLPAFEGPARIIYGTQDRILPDVARTMSRVAADMKLDPTQVTALPGCGHFLQEDRPDEIGQMLAEFFGGEP